MKMFMLIILVLSQSVLAESNKVKEYWEATKYHYLKPANEKNIAENTLIGSHAISFAAPGAVVIASDAAMGYVGLTAGTVVLAGSLSAIGGYGAGMILREVDNGVAYLITGDEKNGYVKRTLGYIGEKSGVFAAIHNLQRGEGKEFDLNNSEEREPHKEVYVNIAP